MGYLWKAFIKFDCEKVSFQLQASSEARVSREKAAVLEAVLEQKNNSDDVQVLRNELHNVQQVSRGSLKHFRFENIFEKNSSPKILNGSRIFTAVRRS